MRRMARVSLGMGAYLGSISSSAIVAPLALSSRLPLTLPTLRPAMRTSASFTRSAASLNDASKR